MTTEKVTYNRRLGKWVVRQREADEKMKQTGRFSRFSRSGTPNREEIEEQLEEWRKLEKLEDQVLNRKKDDTGRQDPLTVGKKEETINRGVPLRGQRTIQRFQEPVPMAAQVFNQTCPSTQSTVALPAWQFSGIGGFDRPSQLYDANDFVQRVQMMDPGVPVQTWTGPAPVGSKGSAKGKQAEHQRKCNTCGGPCHCEYQDEMGEQLCWLCYHSDQTM